jgi:hypothetical protein
VGYDPRWRAKAGVNRNRGKMGAVAVIAGRILLKTGD